MSKVQAQIREIEQKIKKLRSVPRTPRVDRRITELIEWKTQLRLRRRKDRRWRT